MNDVKKTFTQEEAYDFLHAQVEQSRNELKEELLPALKHGEKERLLLAIALYPQTETDFSDDRAEVIRAFSALKICIDSQVALGVEMVIQELGELQKTNQGEQ